MTHPLLTTPNFRLDWTGFRDILFCPRLAWHRRVLRRVPNKTESALNFGKAIHAAIDERQKMLMAGQKPDIARLQAKLEPFFAAQEPEPVAEPGAESFDFAPASLPDETDHRTLGRAREVVQLYDEHHVDDDSFDILATEQFGERELGTVIWHDGQQQRQTQVIWEGRTDGIWRDRRNGQTYVKDTKTAKDVQRQEWELLRYRLGGQLRMYCWLFSGREWGMIQNGIVDHVVVRKPLVKVTAKNKPRNEFNRLVLGFSPDEIEGARASALQVIKGWFEQCGSMETTAPLHTSCVQFGWTCADIAVCSQADPASRMRWLQSGAYKENVWNPKENND